MGLLELLQQGQTTLSAGSFPGDTPINDPQSGFVQDNSIYNSYEDETIGQPNNGSVLVNTLDDTALDITDFDQSNNTDSPTYDWVTNYPPLVTGEFNSAPSLYNLTYTPNSTYLENTPIQTTDSPQLNTLNETGLDNTDEASETTIVPDSLNYPNNYPAIQNVSLGAFNGAPSQYESLYSPDSTYLDTYNTVTNDNTNPLSNNLSSSGLDNTYPFEAAPTAEIPSDGTVYPAFSTGQWQGAPQLFTQKYGPSTNQYYPPFVTTSNADLLSQQYDSLPKTGLDVDNENAIPTTDVVVNPDNITVYPASNVTGVTGSAPQLFNQVWKPVKKYYNDYIKPLKDQSLA